jgi:hypothetical protein
MNTTIIRFDQQSAFSKGIDTFRPKEYVEKLGMKVIQYSQSSFGACYFLEVENYVFDSNSICIKLETDPKTFEWDSY